MWVTSNELLRVLPPFNNRSVAINSSQDVDDIVNEVLKSHKLFANDYDRIWKFFNRESIDDICQQLFQFCKENIQYEIETDRLQTTRSPAAILALGHGDCKHYAGFIGGVLAAIGRNTGERIDCWYRFASYDIFDRKAGHVFIVVGIDGEEIWIDPVLGRLDERLIPYYISDNKINTMALHRLSGFADDAMFRYAFEDSIGAGPDPTDPTGGAVSEEALNGKVQGIELDLAINLFNKITEIIKGDKVPNYPVKSQNTFNSLKASIYKQIGLPPTSVEDAKRMLAIAYEERALSVARGTDRATLTAIMLTDEVIAALKLYIQNGGESSGGSTSVRPASGGTGGEGGTSSGKNTLLIVAGIGLILYFAFKKSR